mgnify:CR=1 FL=1
MREKHLHITKKTIKTIIYVIKNYFGFQMHCYSTIIELILKYKMYNKKSSWSRGLVKSRQKNWRDSRSRETEVGEKIAATTTYL